MPVCVELENWDKLEEEHVIVIRDSVEGGERTEILPFKFVRAQLKGVEDLQIGNKNRR